jgi:hypothetical protein
MKDKDGNTELAIAIMNRKSEDEILQLIEHCPDDIQEKNNAGFYPVEDAFTYSEAVVLQLLTRFPKLATERDIYWSYPLHYVCRNHKEKVVLQVLKEFPQAASEQDTYGRLPLCIAIECYQSEKVMFALLDTNLLSVKGFDVEDRIPLDYAKIFGYNNYSALIDAVDAADAVDAVDAALARITWDYEGEKRKVEAVFNVLEILTNMTDYELEHRINIPTCVVVNGLDNRRRMERYKWLMLHLVSLHK